jgi:hypothetical protein
VVSAATSGHLTVTTVGGTAVSSGDFFVPPPGYAAGNVQSTGRMSIGGSDEALAIPSGQFALRLFDGAQGHRVSARFSSVTIAIGSAAIYDPWGQIPGGNAKVGLSAGATTFIEPFAAENGGSYTVLVAPSGSYSGNKTATVTLYDVPNDVTGPIVPGGSSVPVTVTTPGQNARLTFSGTNGQRVSAAAASTTIPASTMSVLRPDGTTLGSAGFSANSSNALVLEPLTLPSTGTCTLLADPNGINIGSTTLTLYDVPADVTGPIVPGGAGVPVSLSTPGQNARLTFSGTQNERVSLSTTSTTIPSGVMKVLKPDGSAVGQTGFNNGSTGFLEPVTLPTTDTYTVLVDPTGIYTGATTARLYDVPADDTGTVTINGSSSAVTLAVGQNATRTFTGTASQQVTVHVTGNTMGQVIVKLLSTNGTTVLAQALSPASGFNLSTVTLPTTTPRGHTPSRSIRRVRTPER